MKTICNYVQFMGKWFNLDSPHDAKFFLNLIHVEAKMKALEQGIRLVAQPDAYNLSNVEAIKIAKEVAEALKDRRDYDVRWKDAA